MSDSPDAIREDIEKTRRDLGLDVDALADKVTPSKIVDRQVGRMKGAVTSVRERIMGAADDSGSALRDTGSSAVAGVSDAGRQAVAKAQGNPLAVGLMAFGAGLLIASLVPASEKEKSAASAVKDQAQPLLDEAAGAAREMGEHLKEPAQEAVAAVKDTAAEAASHVKEDATGAAGNVTDRARDAGQQVQGG
ncbi:DUF3618 domain-containing protein [Microbacterium caowuchunii]|uniref:DUF3618 domain-containing protein n=1 Tax=Microbacterium caowuchunii TaxID=2614638 RepID=A0A5N0T4S1_9MICO|nr:DUF3618 domain-containing protein [Microbacterium caowuchunii]KAA9130055.1 DUF3618 domain-containing protein [Microbacterium caowuchunii]